MNNSTFTRSAIHMYAHALRQNRVAIIDNYTCLIENEVGKLFPILKEKSENGVQDWACDIINCDSKQEVDATLDRINDILTDQTKTEYVCEHCGKNTANVPIRNLVGTNHIFCVGAVNLNTKNRSQSDPNSVVLDTLRRLLCELDTQLTKMQNILNELEHTDYHHKPTHLQDPIVGDTDGSLEYDEYPHITKLKK